MPIDYLKENFKTYIIYDESDDAEGCSQCEEIGNIDIPKADTFQDMPEKLEINGYTYNIFNG